MNITERKTLFRNIIVSLCLAAVLVFTAMPVKAASSNVNSRIRQLMYYYQYYQDDAQADIDRLIEEITQLDADQGDKWDRIMEFWSWMNREMKKIPDVLPDGLPEDDSLCIVVLGYGLESDGDMKPELIGRMETALNCAEKYPNAYVLCTGGGTAAGNKTVTEAGQMSKWLKEHGIDENRIIVEQRSRTTAMNAQYSCRILREDYPQVHSLALVTSDYHIRRGCLVFNTESVLTDSGLEIVGNAVYVANRDVTETFTYQAYEISQLISVGYKNDAPYPKLSKLERISAECESPCEAGLEPCFAVTAHYDSGYSRNVTENPTYSGIDFNVAGWQTMTISYTEKGKTYTAEAEIEIIIPETEAPPTETVPETQALPTETVAETEALPTEIILAVPQPTESGNESDVSGKPVPQFPLIPVLGGAGAVVFLIILIRLLRPRKGKYQK